MAIWFTSDLHISHLNIIRYCEKSRPFSNVIDMNEALVRNWNNVVRSDDTVYILGDLCFGPINTADEYLPRLAGHKILVPGNHDYPKRLKKYAELGVEIIDTGILEYKDIKFYLSHYPREDVKNVTEDYDCWLYGHVHDMAPKCIHANQYHVGVDTNNLIPVNAEDIYLAVKANQSAF